MVSNSRLLLTGVAVAGLVIGSSLVTWADSLLASDMHVLAMPDIPSVLIGMAGGLSFYLWRVTDGEPFRWVMAGLHTALGSFFGFIGAKAALGFGANEQLQTVANAIGGGMGPRALDKIESFVRK